MRGSSASSSTQTWAGTTTSSGRFGGWDKAGSLYIEVSWGRVGAKGQSQQRIESESWLNRKIAAQIKEGYKEVELATTADLPATASVAAPVGAMVVAGRRTPESDLVAHIFREAGEAIKTYLATTVDKMGPGQIARGRALLDEAVRVAALGSPFGPSVIDLAQDFFTTIPTKLPHRINPVEVARNFMGSLSEYEDRLNQLEAAIATGAATVTGTSQTNALGAHIARLDPSAQLYGQLADLIRKSAVHGYAPQIADIFEVCVPTERAAYEACPIGKRRKDGAEGRHLLFHGSKAKNVRHILRTGLIVPRSYTNGWNFGQGIYFAPNSTKSDQYCSAQYGPKMLMIAEVAAGEPFVPKTSNECGNFRGAPRGYDSVWAKGGKGGTAKGGRNDGPILYDEVIVYQPAQQTLRYIVTIR
jgi:poly [ADP-ribose] polymerase 2/3/4